MPAHVPVGSAAEFIAKIGDLERRIRALETSQYHVFLDPTGSTGDPAHAHAVFVLGNLLPITGIAGFGAASFRTGAWLQI